MAFLETPNSAAGRGDPQAPHSAGALGAEQRVCATAARAPCAYSLPVWQEKRRRLGWEPGSLGAWVGTVGNEPAVIGTCRIKCTRDLTLGELREYFIRLFCLLRRSNPVSIGPVVNSIYFHCHDCILPSRACGNVSVCFHWWVRFIPLSHTMAPPLLGNLGL